MQQKLLCLTLTLGAGLALVAAPPTTLTLDQAEQIALKNHPRIGSAELSAQAAGKVVSEVRSAFQPTISGNLTGTAAENSTTVAAGALTTSALSSRFAAGIGLVQLITDFGRNASLTRAAKLQQQAANANVTNMRASIILEVRRAYFAALGADSVQKAAQAALDARRLLLRQVTALAQSSLKSTLDVSFAQVLVSEAELAVFQAENNVQESRAQLAAAMGSEQTQNLILVDQPLADQLNPDVQALVDQALRDRPDLNILQRKRDAAYQFAQAEKKLSYPTINLLGAAGGIPEHDHTLPHDNYAAAGVNVNIPIFNGGLFSARRSEALLRAQAAEKDVQDFSIQVSRDVRTAWFEANTSFRRLDVMHRLVEQAAQALHLAQARYNAGLGSILEVNQAQLTEISAEIDAAGAKYDYLTRHAVLDYAMGALR